MAVYKCFLLPLLLHSDYQITMIKVFYVIKIKTNQLIFNSNAYSVTIGHQIIVYAYNRWIYSQGFEKK